MTHLLTFPSWMVQWLFWVILGAALDAAVGVATSLVKRTFDLALVGRWVVTNVLSVVVGVVVVAMLVAAGLAPGYIFVSAASTAVATFVGMISMKIGIPIKFRPPSGSAPPQPTA